MSTFGILAMFAFMIVVAGSVVMIYGGTENSFTGKILTILLYLLMTAETVLAVIQYPCYVIDGIVFACMGYKWLANVMFIIFAVIVLFIIGFALSKIKKWDKFLSVSAPKLIICGVILLTLFAYTELYNGLGSFNGYDEFHAVKTQYEQYDRNFWPTKYVKHKSKIHERECVSVYPFDAKTASGRQPLVYRADIYEEMDEAGRTRLYYYPFTWKAYEHTQPVEFTDPNYVAVHTEEDYHVSETDVSDSDVSDADVQPLG